MKIEDYKDYLNTICGLDVEINDIELKKDMNSDINVIIHDGMYYSLNDLIIEGLRYIKEKYNLEINPKYNTYILTNISTKK